MTRFITGAFAIVFTWAGIVAMLEATDKLIGFGLLTLGLLTLIITMEKD